MSPSLGNRLAWRVSTAVSSFGARWHVDALVYNPWQMWAYHQAALTDADGVARALAETFPQAHRFVDVGAGSGAFAAALARVGKHVLAVERSRVGRMIAARQGVGTLEFDLAAPEPIPSRITAEVAYSFEVAEHLVPQLGQRLVRVLARLAPTVVFTAAPPGQGGLGHVNEQPSQYWIERFRAQGMEPSCEQATLRRAFRSHGVQASWFANVMVFSARKSEPDA